MMGAVAEPGHLRHGDPLPDADIPPATETHGGQLLAYREENGVKVFELTSRLVKWHILPDVQVTAMTYNGTVPGPEIRVTQGDRVKVLLKNELPYPTTIHWHGILVPNNMDGVPDMTQATVPPGGSFTYEFTAEPAGTYWYHSHVQTDAQMLAGLCAPFIRLRPIRRWPPACKAAVGRGMYGWSSFNRNVGSSRGRHGLRRMHATRPTCARGAARRGIGERVLGRGESHGSVRPPPGGPGGHAQGR
jgi:hypothetical protein